MSFDKLKAVTHSQIARWTLVLALLTTLQTSWYLFAEKMDPVIYIVIATFLTISVQLINIVYGKQIAKYKASQEDGDAG